MAYSLENSEIGSVNLQWESRIMVVIILHATSYYIIFVVVNPKNIFATELVNTVEA